MNFELFIARKIVFSKSSEQRISRPITRIAVAGVAVGFAVMLLAVAIVTGFQKEIRDKVIGFGSHIQVTNFDENNSFETKPIERNAVQENEIKKIDGVRHVQFIATKVG